MLAGKAKGKKTKVVIRDLGTDAGKELDRQATKKIRGGEFVLMPKAPNQLNCGGPGGPKCGKHKAGVIPGISDALIGPFNSAPKM